MLLASFTMFFSFYDCCSWSLFVYVSVEKSIMNRWGSCRSRGVGLRTHHSLNTVQGTSNLHTYFVLCARERRWVQIHTGCHENIARIKDNLCSKKNATLQCVLSKLSQEDFIIFSKSKYFPDTMYIWVQYIMNTCTFISRSTLHTCTFISRSMLQTWTFIFRSMLHTCTHFQE